MPNLRKNSTVLTYNDDAIYKAMENQRKMKRPTKLLLPSVKQLPVAEEDDDNIPDVVFAQDGRQFFPCLYCCHAFAIKADQLSHMRQCNFNKTVNKVPDPVPRPALNKTPNITIKPKKIQTQVEHVIVKPEISFYDDSTSQDSPNEIVQNPQNIDSLMKNKALTVIKKVPTKIGFPKIKFKFPQKIQNIKFKSVDMNHRTTEEDVAAGSTQTTPPKLTFSKEELKRYHDLYRKSDMSKCTICFKAVGKGCWYRHLRTHCSEKKYSCGACDKKFGRKDHRDLHEKTHTTNNFLNNS